MEPCALQCTSNAKMNHPYNYMYICLTKSTGMALSPQPQLLQIALLSEVCSMCTYVALLRHSACFVPSCVSEQYLFILTAVLV